MSASTSPAIWYARIFGIVLTLVGIAGFVLTTDFEPSRTLIAFDVNIVHNVVHLATGVLGLVAGFAALSLARTYAVTLGVVYVLVGIWGMIDSNPLGLFHHINVPDNLLHIAIGVAGLAAFAMSRTAAEEPRARR